MRRRAPDARARDARSRRPLAPSRSVQETCNFDALFSYLNSGNYDFRYDLSKGLRPRRSVRTAIAHEILMYSIVQSTPLPHHAHTTCVLTCVLECAEEGLGLDKAIEEVKHRMSRYQVT